MRAHGVALGQGSYAERYDVLASRQGLACEVFRWPCRDRPTACVEGHCVPLPHGALDDPVLHASLERATPLPRDRGDPQREAQAARLAPARFVEDLRTALRRDRAPF